MRSTYCLILLFLFYVWFAVLERVHNPFIKYYLDNSLRGNKLIQTWTNLAKDKKNKQKKKQPRETGIHQKDMQEKGWDKPIDLSMEKTWRSLKKTNMWMHNNFSWLTLSKGIIEQQFFCDPNSLIYDDRNE